MLSKNYKQEIISTREEIRRELREEIRLVHFENISQELKKKLIEKVIVA